MHLFYRSLILAATVSQTLGLPAEPIASRATGPLDDWIAKESTLAKQLLLANIGAGGINDRGSASGLIVASPSDTNPNCE